MSLAGLLPSAIARARRMLNLHRAGVTWAAGSRGGHRRVGKKPGVGWLRTRLPVLTMGVLGVLLLAAAVVSTFTAGRQAELADLDAELSSHAASRASALTAYFERAQSINLLLALDSVFQPIERGEGQLSGPQLAIAAAQAGKSMTYLEKLYPGQISEACLIDSTGAELSRVTKGKVISTADLSTDEAEAPFFAPTMRLAKGRVYQGSPYLSEDTHQWVISNSTPMVTASGRTWGLLHFEVPLDSFRLGMDGEGTMGFSDRIVDNLTGRVLLDSERPLVDAASPQRDGSAELRAIVASPAAVASGMVDGQRVAMARISVPPDNANSWSVLVAAPPEAMGWSSAIGPAPIATSLAALLLLLFAGNLRAIHQAERQSEAHYRTLIDKSSDLVLVVDRAGRSDFLSPSVERLLMPRDNDPLIAAQEPVDSGPVDFIAAVDPEDRARLSEALQAAAPGCMSVGEFRIPGTHGTSTYEMTVQDLTADPSVRGLVLTAHDVTDRLALHQEMEHLALHDTLTGLPNRALLADRFEQALRGAERDGTSAGLLLLDLDRFKEVNDTFGHHYGDELLRQIGPRMTGVLRGVDTIARLGGDEFAVLLPDLHGVEDATKVAAALVAALAIPFPVEGVDLDVEASIGVVISGVHGDDPVTLMQRADIAMYIAKTQHLGLYVYDPSVNGHSRSKLALVEDLRRALACRELVLHYQPKVSVSTGEVLGAEALVRWQHPVHGLLLPDEFTPLLESTTLIGPLTHYVLDAALAQARTWIEAGRPLPIAVNLSARNLQDEGFADQVAELLAARGVPAHLFELEVTENAIMTDPVRARETLEQLSALGVRLSIDDFGAGYVSLSQLTSLPINEIKMDRSFVITMADDLNNALIVRSVVDLGHILGLTQAAESVENDTALTAVAGLGCDSAQGYYLSRPLPAADFDTWWAERRGQVSRAGDVIAVPG